MKDFQLRKIHEEQFEIFDYFREKTKKWEGYVFLLFDKKQNEFFHEYMHESCMDLAYEWTKTNRNDADLIAYGLENSMSGHPYLIIETYDVIFPRKFNKRTVKVGKKLKFYIQSKFR